MWTHWVNVVLGIWLIISSFTPYPGQQAHNIIVGALVLVFAVLGVRAHQREAPAVEAGPGAAAAAAAEKPGQSDTGGGPEQPRQGGGPGQQP